MIRPCYACKISVVVEMIYGNAYDLSAKIKIKQEGPWPWVTHLRMDVSKGIGKHSSSQRPAMNIDRSAVTLRLNKGYIDKINRM